MKNILVVDDSPTMRRMVMASLRAVGNVRFYEAESGLEAIEKLSLSSVDLIMLDLNMPDMHGMEVLKFVRSHQRYAKLPVIILTTRGDEESRTTAIEAGASLYMTKPFRPASLVSGVQQFLKAD